MAVLPGEGVRGPDLMPVQAVRAGPDRRLGHRSGLHRTGGVDRVTHRQQGVDLSPWLSCHHLLGGGHLGPGLSIGRLPQGEASLHAPSGEVAEPARSHEIHARRSGAGRYGGGGEGATPLRDPHRGTLAGSGSGSADHDGRPPELSRRVSLGRFGAGDERGGTPAGSVGRAPNTGRRRSGGTDTGAEEGPGSTLQVRGHNCREGGGGPPTESEGRAGGARPGKRRGRVLGSRHRRGRVRRPACGEAVMARAGTGSGHRRQRHGRGEHDQTPASGPRPAADGPRRRAR